MDDEGGYFFLCGQDADYSVDYLGPTTRKLSVFNSGVTCNFININILGKIILESGYHITLSGMVYTNYNNITNIVTELEISENSPCIMNISMLISIQYNSSTTCLYNMIMLKGSYKGYKTSVDSNLHACGVISAGSSLMRLENIALYGL